MLRATTVTRWPEEHRDRIERFFLPVCIPELDAYELLNQEVNSTELNGIVIP